VSSRPVGSESLPAAGSLLLDRRARHRSV